MNTQVPYTEPRQEVPIAPPAQREGGSGPQYQEALYDERFLDAPAQRLVPRLKSLSPVATPGTRLALAITSLVALPGIFAIVAIPGGYNLGFRGVLIAVAAICAAILNDYRQAVNVAQQEKS